MSGKRTAEAIRAGIEREGQTPAQRHADESETSASSRPATRRGKPASEQAPPRFLSMNLGSGMKAGSLPLDVDLNEGRSQPVEAIALVKRALRSVRDRSSHVKGAYGVAGDSAAARHP
ncbi:MAG: hypothetical protein LC776_01630 [Acidobacteria bacterium]|nr:hypothetical protein [Acidobacteriota bacterium]